MGGLAVTSVGREAGPNLNLRASRGVFLGRESCLWYHVLEGGPSHTAVITLSSLESLYSRVGGKLWMAVCCVVACCSLFYV